MAAAIAMGIAAIVRKRFDLVSATMDWPPYLRLAVRTVISISAPSPSFVLLSVTRIGIRASFDRPRTYLLGVAINLATAWVVINIAASLIHNQFVNRVVAVSAWTIAALSILRLLDPIVRRSIRSRLDRRIADHAAAGPQDPALMLLTVWAAIAASNFMDRRMRGFPDLTPSIQVLLEQADPHRAADRSRSSSC